MIIRKEVDARKLSIEYPRSNVGAQRLFKVLSDVEKLTLSQVRDISELSLVVHTSSNISTLITMLPLILVGVGHINAASAFSPTSSHITAQQAWFHNQSFAQS